MVTKLLSHESSRATVVCMMILSTNEAIYWNDENLENK